jgi:N-methylhydantoinase B
MCQMRIRVPEQWWGDYLAMIGAARIGERELLALGAELGWETLHAHEEEFFDYSEQRMIAAIRRLKPGKGVHRSRHDHFPGTPEEGIPIQAKVTVDTDAAMIDIDLTDNPDCMPCGLNLSEACARTAAMVGLFNSIDHGVPKNAGAFRRLRVHLRRGCIVGIPRHPTSCSVATTNLADRVSNCVQAAFAGMAEGQGLAEAGAIIPPSAGVISGTLPNGARFVNQVFLGLSGGPGAPGTDAWQTLCHVGNAGLCFQDSIELDELRQPIHIFARRFLPDTEGAGRHSGSSSILVEFGPVGCDIDIGYVSDGTDNAPQGVRGGLNGAPARQVRVTRNGEVEQLPGCAQVQILQGERVRSFSCGGGGYGPPGEREPAAVAKDVREGWVSAERARSVYRVALDASGNVDTPATAVLRG